MCGACRALAGRGLIKACPLTCIQKQLITQLGPVPAPGSCACHSQCPDPARPPLQLLSSGPHGGQGQSKEGGRKKGPAGLVLALVWGSPSAHPSHPCLEGSAVDTASHAPSYSPTFREPHGRGFLQPCPGPWHCSGQLVCSASPVPAFSAHLGPALWSQLVQEGLLPPPDPSEPTLHPPPASQTQEGLTLAWKQMVVEEHMENSPPSGTAPPRKPQGLAAILRGSPANSGGTRS